MATRSTKRRLPVSYQTNAANCTSVGAMAGTRSQIRSHGMAMEATETTNRKRDTCQSKKMMKMCTGRGKDGAGTKIRGNTIPMLIGTIDPMPGKGLLQATPRIKAKKLLKMMLRVMILSLLFRLRLQLQWSQLLSQQNLRLLSQQNLQLPSQLL